MVVVTGIGLIAPHGDDPAAMFDALMRGEWRLLCAVHNLLKLWRAAQAAIAG